MATPNDHHSAHYRKKAIPPWLVSALMAGPRRRIYERFAAAFPPEREQRVLDLGVNASSDRPEGYYFERHYPHLDRVVACGLESPEGISVAYPQVQYVQNTREAERLPFEDEEFDVVFCNAVIEHVGTRDAQRRFLGEILRVGKRAFVTTPNRWYPVETHTVVPLLHYLPANVYRPLYRRIGFDFFSHEENLNLLDRRALHELLPSGDERPVRIDTLTFLGLPSNLLLFVG